MEIKRLSLTNSVWSLVVLMSCIGLTSSFNDYDSVDDSDDIFKYNRIAEIEQHCGSLASSGSRLVPDDRRAQRLQRELSFENGDWEQDSGGAPLMPSFNTDQFDPHSLRSKPLKLVSFQVKDVSSNPQLENSLSLGGIMLIGITTNKPISYRRGFHPHPDSPLLSIQFEGAYVENKDQRLLCLLGKLVSLSPFEPESVPQVLDSDQILLVLKYPHTVNLTKQEIRGKMSSLSEHGAPNYFDEVRISSLMNRNADYQFGNEIPNSKYCSTCLYEKEFIQDGVQLFNGSQFCKYLKMLSRGIFSIMPHWNSDANNSEFFKSGPFEEITVSEWNTGEVRLTMSHTKCRQEKKN
ncbi:hypothetical protein QQ045_013647 [Rhodiola kirilowii]